MRPRAPLAGIAVLLLAAPMAGCAGTASRPPDSMVIATPVRVALLPLENLSGRADAADALTRMLSIELTRRGGFEVIEGPELDAAMDSLRLRAVSSLSTAQLRSLGSRLSVGYVLLGSLLESSIQHTPDGDVPAAGVALKLLDVASGRVIWAKQAFRSGDDHESLFGWGREENPQRLAMALAREVIADLRVPEHPAPGAATGGNR